MRGAKPDTPWPAAAGVSDTRDRDAPASDAQDRELRTDHLLANIGKRTLRGGILVFAAQGVKVLAQFGAVVVLARLLPPAAFGLVAMIGAIYAVLDPVREFGLSFATIQKPDLTHAQISTLFWINVGLGVLVGSALFLAAPLIAAFYHEPELTAVTHWVALGFFITGAGAQHWALLRRQMRFGTVAALETTVELISFTVAIVCALEGAGYWSLVAHRLTGAVLLVVGCWTLCRWRPSRPSLTPGMGDLLSYGGSLTGTSMVGLLSRSVDQVMIGWFWGASSLGLYERAAKLLMLPINNIVIPVYTVGMPSLSRLAEDRQRYQNAFTQILEKLAMITVPGAALVVVTADWVTAVLFGPQWSSAASIVACFAIVAAYQPSIHVMGLLYMTQVRAAEMVRATILDAACSIVAVACSLPYGPEAVAAALAGTGLLLRTPMSWWLATRRGPVSVGLIYMTMLPPAFAGCAVVAAVWALREFVLPAHITPLLGLAAAVPVAVLAAGLVFCVVPTTRRGLLGCMSAGRVIFGGT